MVWSKMRKDFGPIVVALVLAGLVATGLGRDWTSTLAPVKGKKCTVYLKTGEVRKGKVVKIGEDYITVEVKLSPFYAEPQTYQIAEVERIEYDKGAIDVEELLRSGEKGAEGPRSQRKEAAQASQSAQAKGKPSTSKARSESDDETVQRLMAILKSLDGGASAREEQNNLAAAVEPAGSAKSPASQPGARSTDRGEVQARVQPANASSRPSPTVSRRERARKVVVPLTRKAVRTQPVVETAKKKHATQSAQKVSRTSRSVRRTPSASRSPSSTARRSSVRKTKPKRTIPAPKPPKSRLAEASVTTAGQGGQRRAPSAESAASQSAGKLAVAPESQRRERKTVAAGGVGRGTGTDRAAVPVSTNANGQVFRAVTVLAGAVGFLALAVLVLAVVVLKRHRTGATTMPATVPSPEEPPATVGPAPSQASQQRLQPIRVVMVKGDYAVVDQGLDHGIKVGELLLLRRTLEDGEYEIGLARVLKVFDRLSGVKLVERWVETDLRVGDSAFRYRPAEPEAEDVNAVVVTQATGRPHPTSVQDTRRTEAIPPVGLPSQAGMSRRSGWSG